LNNQTIILIAAVAVVIVAAVIVAAVAMRGRRSQKLRDKYGPEYDYTLEKAGDRRAAEETLLDREKRVSQLEIRTLNPGEYEQYHQKWVAIQADFVDKPAEAVERADRLIKEVMVARGFPMADFEQRAADISVLYPDFVTNYRNAHAIAVKSQNDGVSTEELRQAMVYDRSLFEELLETGTSKEKEKVTTSP
jgi:hypothetical protein